MRQVQRVLKSLLVILLLLSMGAVGLYAFAERRFSAAMARRYGDVPLPLASAAGGDQIIGDRIVNIRNGCTDCHGVDLGGGTVMEDPGIGRIYAPNITPSELAGWSDGEIARAIRDGVGRDGRPLLFMPSQDYHRFSESDLRAVVAYLRGVPSKRTAIPAPEAGPLLKILYTLGQAETTLAVETFDHAAGFPEKPPEGPTAAFGGYLISTACKGCHGLELRGGRIPGGSPEWPAASNLTKAGLKAYTADAFATTLRTGVTPAGRELQAPMPIHLTRKLTDTELQAMWAFLSSP